MKTNVNKREILKSIASAPSNTLKERMQWRKDNKEWLKLSHSIAVAILNHLHSEKITQTELAEKLNISPQYVSKIVKGSENLTIETICKIQKALDITLININTTNSPI